MGEEIEDESAILAAQEEGVGDPADGDADEVTFVFINVCNS